MSNYLEAKLSPSFHARHTGQPRDFDLTMLIGNTSGDRPWPMYSFEGPSHIVWNSLGRKLFERGWTDAEIRTWLQSKEARWALDGALGDALENAARDCADHATKVG